MGPGNQESYESGPGRQFAGGAPVDPAPKLSDPGQVVAAERRRPDALAGRVIDRVGDGRRCRRTGGLAKAAPFRSPGRGEIGLDLWILMDAEQVVGIEVG